MKLFALALYCENEQRTIAQAGLCIAESNMEATIDALDECLQLFPMEDGFFGHSVSVSEVPLEYIQRCAL